METKDFVLGFAAGKAQGGGGGGTIVDPVLPSEYQKIQYATVEEGTFPYITVPSVSLKGKYFAGYFRGSGPFVGQYNWNMNATDDNHIYVEYGCTFSAVKWYDDETDPYVLSIICGTITSDDTSNLTYGGKWRGSDSYRAALSKLGKLYIFESTLVPDGGNVKMSYNLIKDLIPCYWKADDVVGFYDTTTSTFYTPQSGTFGKGPDEN